MELKRFAELVILNRLKGLRILDHELDSFNKVWEFRKGKTKGDIHNALAKALKHGREKYEFEVSMLEGYYLSIFKKRKVIKNGVKEGT
jgi:hypothetical protein